MARVIGLVLRLHLVVWVPRLLLWQPRSQVFPGPMHGGDSLGARLIICIGVHTSHVPRPFPPPVTVCDQKLDRGGNGLGTRLGAYQWQNITRTKMKNCM